jgi:hypothetical protein
VIYYLVDTTLLTADNCGLITADNDFHFPRFSMTLSEIETASGRLIGKGLVLPEYTETEELIIW